MTVTIDTSQLIQLSDLLTANVAGMEPEIQAVLYGEVNLTAAAGRQTAAGYPKATGELASEVSTDMGPGLTGRVYANVRQAWFLEVGSPNTGAPRPWLSEPAERSQERLYAHIIRVAKPT